MFSIKEKVSALNHISVTFSSMVIRLSLNLLIGIVVARALGPNGKGLLAVIVMIGTTIINLGNLGISSFNTFAISNKSVEEKDIISNSFWLGLIISLISFFVVLVLAFNLPIFFRNIPRSYLLIYLVSLPFIFWANFFDGILIGEQKFRLYNIFSVITQLISLIGVILLLLVFRLNVFYVVVWYALINIIDASLPMRSVLSRYGLSFKINVNVFKKSLDYGLRIFLTGIFSLLILRIDLYMVNFFKGMVEAGLYSLASTFGNIFFYLPSSITTVMFPKINIENKSKKESVARYSRISFLSVSVLALGTLLFIKFPIGLLYGREFLSAVQPILLLLPGLIALSVSNVLGLYFLSTKYPFKLTISWFLATILNALLNFIYIPQYGMVAAAITSTISYLLVFGFHYYFFHKETKMGFYDILVPRKEEISSIIERIMKFLNKGIKNNT
ncbi:MAG: oligosaccharide flippase family protein [Candidatus Pacebacteria bacterium]|nr:oligosaccharide flippase family protein [Candidatus Paceibacterota bacterium]MDD5722061.1 oligosaccharide flippase family protein [Candidatus Paceibacterota bacterium]